MSDTVELLYRQVVGIELDNREVLAPPKAERSTNMNLSWAIAIILRKRLQREKIKLSIREIDIEKVLTIERLRGSTVRKKIRSLKTTFKSKRFRWLAKY